EPGLETDSTSEGRVGRRPPDQSPPARAATPTRLAHGNGKGGGSADSWRDLRPFRRFLRTSGAAPGGGRRGAWRGGGWGGWGGGAAPPAAPPRGGPAR